MSTVVGTDKTRPSRVFFFYHLKRVSNFFSLLFVNIINIHGTYTNLTVLPPILTLGYSQSLILDIYKVKQSY